MPINKKNRLTRSKVLVEARDITFTYDNEQFVLKETSLQIEEGRLVGLIGANGSGKSTLVRLLAGLLHPTSGKVYFGGQSLTRISKQCLARSLAYVPQINPMFFPFTALEVVLTGRTPYRPRFRFENRIDAEKALDALDRVGARSLAYRPVTELSGGERQLVAIARALAQEPKCLLLDEPSTALDLKHRAMIVQILKSLRDEKNITSLVVTHDLQLIDTEFDQILAINQGSIVDDGTPLDILTESVLSRVYSDPSIHTYQIDGRIFVWSGN